MSQAALSVWGRGWKCGGAEVGGEGGFEKKDKASAYCPAKLNFCIFLNLKCQVFIPVPFLYFLF